MDGPHPSQRLAKIVVGRRRSVASGGGARLASVASPACTRLACVAILLVRRRAAKVPAFPSLAKVGLFLCVSAWKKDPSGGVIGVQKGPLW
jgi:hypothetical protein